MKILVLKEKQNVGGVVLGAGEHADQVLIEKKVDRRAIAQLVSVGRAAWRHGELSKAQPVEAVEAVEPAAAEVVPRASAVKKSPAKS